MERMTVKYEELSEEVGGLEEEWKKYKEAFVGVAKDLCGRTYPCEIVILSWWGSLRASLTLRAMP